MAKYRRFINCNKCAFDNKELPIFEEYDPYIHFSDPKVKKIAEETYGDETGKVKAKVWHNINGFTNNFNSSDIEYFPELATMGINYPNADLGSKFTKCENLKYIIINRKLGSYTFADGCPNLEYVILENTNKTNLVSIDYASFNKCSKLKHVKLLDTITIIKNGAFGHTGVVSINKKDDRNTFDLNNVTTLENGSFNYCNKLEYADISKIEELGNDVFYNDPLLKTVILNPNLTKLGNYVFYNCKLLEMDSLPEGITSLGNSCFSNCTNITLTELPEGITSIGKGAFNETHIKITSLPETITKLGGFYNCKDIELTKLPDGLIEIYDHTFYGCDPNKVVFSDLPNGLKRIQSGTFSGAKVTIPHEEWYMPNLETINDYWGQTNQWIQGKNLDISQVKIVNFPKLYLVNDENNHTSGVNFVCNAANNNIEKIIMPSLTLIGSDSFKNCTKLKQLNSDIDGVADISKVTKIGGYGTDSFRGKGSAFAGCELLTKFILNDIPPRMPNYNETSVINNFPSDSKFYVSSEEVKQAYLNDEKWSLFDPDRFVIGTMETIRQEMETL